MKYIRLKESSLNSVNLNKFDNAEDTVKSIDYILKYLKIDVKERMLSDGYYDDINNHVVTYTFNIENIPFHFSIVVWKDILNGGNDVDNNSLYADLYTPEYNQNTGYDHGTLSNNAVELLSKLSGYTTPDWIESINNVQ